MPDTSFASLLESADGVLETTRHLVYRWALGELPFSGKGGREIGGWIQFREPAACLMGEPYGTAPENPWRSANFWNIWVRPAPNEKMEPISRLRSAVSSKKMLRLAPRSSSGRQ